MFLALSVVIDSVGNTIKFLMLMFICSSSLLFETFYQNRARWLKQSDWTEDISQTMRLSRVGILSQSQIHLENFTRSSRPQKTFNSRLYLQYCILLFNALYDMFVKHPAHNAPFIVSCFHRLVVCQHHRGAGLGPCYLSKLPQWHTGWLGAGCL